MKLSHNLAADLLKLEPNEIGSFADKTFKDGVAAFKEHGLYGYIVGVDTEEHGHAVEFDA